MDVIHKITGLLPPPNKKETQAFLGVVGFWRRHIPGYILIISPLYQVTQEKNSFEWVLSSNKPLNKLDKR